MSQRTVLVTGFPSLRAQHVVSALGAQAGVRVLALVHPERWDEAEDALGRLDAAARPSELIAGDPAAIDFGLSGPSYLQLARTVHSVHAAYSVSDATVSEELATNVNLGAARELVEFARAATSLTSLVFYSSVFVSGQRAGLVREDELEAGQTFRGPVERTLAVAERMLRRSGAPSVVLRAGHVLGDTERGVVERLSAPYLLMILMVSAPSDVGLPLPPGADAPLALTPLDYLARFGVAAAERARPGTTFHVVDPAQLPLRGFLGLVAERCGRRLEAGFNPSALTRALVGNPAARLLPQNVRSIFEVLTSSAEYATDNAAELVARGAPACPPLESYLDRLLDHVRERIEHGNLPPGRREAPFLVA